MECNKIDYSIATQLFLLIKYLGCTLDDLRIFPNETEKNKQALKILWGMAEHRFSNVYNYQCLTLVLYLYILKLNRWKKVNNDDDSLASLYKCYFL